MLSPFTVDIPAADLDELRDRLRRTRPPAALTAPEWSAGVPATELARLVRYWADDFDWRSRETWINTFPQFTTPIGDGDVHFAWLRGERPGALPLVLTHGWPSSFVELLALGDRLANPSRYGRSPADSFDVVVPSLPGFGFSAPRQGWPAEPATHDLWHALMHDVLGYSRYGAHGGDLGAGVSTRLAAAHPSAVAGLHVLAAVFPPEVPDPSPAERAYLDEVAAWQAAEGGYQHEQQTRPLTLAYGLSDSPAGLLAWIYEKYRVWSQSPTAFSDDDVLTQASLYWFTNTIATSFRPYHEYRPSWQRVEVPTAIAVFPHDLTRPPRDWVERTYRLTRYTPMPRGGHFAAHEEPGLLADDITAFFRDLR